MDINEQINAIHKEINTPLIIKDVYYRRNHKMYPLVCSINIIIGSYYSNNYKLMYLFMMRSLSYLDKSSEEIPDDLRTYIHNYLKLIFKYVENRIDDFSKKGIEDLYSYILHKIE